MVPTHVIATVSTPTIAWRRNVGATRDIECSSRAIEWYIGATSGARACIIFRLHVWLVVLDRDCDRLVQCFSNIYLGNGRCTYAKWSLIEKRSRCNFGVAGIIVLNTKLSNVALLDGHGVECFELTEGLQSLLEQLESWVSLDGVIAPVKEDGHD